LKIALGVLVSEKNITRIVAVNIVVPLMGYSPSPYLNNKNNYYFL
jgi:hypothetical protein